MPKARATLVVFSFSVLILALVVSRRPDLLARWTGLARGTPAIAPDRPGKSDSPRPSVDPHPSGKGTDGDGHAVPMAPLEPSQPRKVVPITIDLEPSGSIEGRVTDSVGAPQSGRTLSISAMQGEGARSTTDSSGRYRRERLIPGVYLVSLDPTEGADATGMADSVLADVRKGETTVVDFRADRMGRLTGRITRAGNRVAGAQVRVLEMAMAGAQSRVLRATAVATGNDGAYVVAGLSPGPHRLIVTAEIRSPRPGGRSADETVVGLARADRELVLQSGENRLDVELPEARLAGTVVHARTGAPLGLAMILVQPAQSMPGGEGFLERYASLEAGTVLTEEDGGFLLDGLAPGSYRIIATLPGYRRYVGSVTVAAGTTPVRIPLEPGGGRIEVEIVIPQGVFLPLLNLRVSDSGGNALGYYPMGGNDVDHATFERTQQLVSDLAPGRFSLELEVPGQARYTAEVEVTEERTPRVSFVLSPGGGR